MPIRITLDDVLAAKNMKAKQVARSVVVFPAPFGPRKP
jgi:DNA-binding Xre family transcriptional regulator